MRALLFAVVNEPALVLVIQVLDGITAATLGIMVPLMIADITRGTGRFNLAQGIVGTAMGVGRYLKEQNVAVKLIAVQPSEGHDVPGLRNLSELAVSQLFDRSLIDELFEVDFELAYTRAVDLARHEGLFAGPSSGLILEGARRISEREQKGFGVMIFPDNVFKYVSNMVRHVPELEQGITP